jgi:hypothetical protein
LRFKQVGYEKFFLSGHDDVIKINKMDMIAQNLILGNMYVDMDGTINGFNEKTGDKISVMFTTTTWRAPGIVKG